MLSFAVKLKKLPKADIVFPSLYLLLNIIYIRFSIF